MTMVQCLPPGGFWLLDRGANFLSGVALSCGGVDRNFTCSLVVGRRAESSSLCGERG